MNDFQVIDKAAIGSGRMEVMNFLNEVAGRYPAAISFASGRPAERFFRVEKWLASVPSFVSHYAGSRSMDHDSALAVLAQYGRTNGVINDLVARQLGIDEGIHCDEGQIIVTAGCQEAIALCLSALCEDERDVVIVRSPTYIGITGAAELLGVTLAPLVCDDPTLFPRALQEEVGRLKAAGRRPRAIYLTPDFDNPTGTVMGLQARKELLALCHREGIAVLEDNPYGMFRYEGERLPPLTAMDKHGCTLYLGTYSKTLCPALRVGFIAVPRALFGSESRTRQFLDRVSIAKSFVTCNTSQLMQAVVGGVLLAEGGSLSRIVQPARSHYQWNLEVMTDQLHSTLGSHRDRVSWNKPAGGFFMTVTLPFVFGQDEVNCCAERHGVLVMPLSFFALTDDHRYSVRLAFSNLQPSQIKDGIESFADFVLSRLPSCP